MEGVAKCGGGKWADIKKLGYPAIEHRTAVDLKVGGRAAWCLLPDRASTPWLFALLH
jgi:hypothetical protein